MSTARKLATTRARSLRKMETSAEKILWRKLRGRHPDGLKFRRQHPVPPYILDFAERTLKLAIEIDGHTHSSAEELTYDTKRTKFLESKDWTLIRFWNSDVYDHVDERLDTIWRKASELKNDQ